DPIAKMLKEQPRPAAAVPPPATTAPATGDRPAGPLPPAAATAAGNPRQLYEVAYAFLLQQDYAGAEASFLEFLARYPSDALAGSAAYWLGEAYFVRGMYQQAARSFLKGYQTYKASPKAPDSLLKLAMSLDHLGQRGDACATYAELAQKFPQAPQNVKNRAQTERSRLGCT
ncbi:MAG TPA: tol-pal system protein YbgF, partial [Hyphomicrobiaceae bacterium]|nr:tol-pal system protein YbgF [Hyphomicrobiaceae bacterium]